MKNHNYSSNNKKAIKFLLVPSSLVITSIVLFKLNLLVLYWLGTLILSFFFTQTFILLHECGHSNYFKGKQLNKWGGHLFGFLTFIPYFNWKHIHNLHHKWTGWRDKDPTTQDTVNTNNSRFKKWVANICWLFFIPIFYSIYLIGNFWNPFKIKKFVTPAVFKITLINSVIYLVGYTFIFYNFSSKINNFILPAFFISLIWKELIILTQHTHVEIPLAGKTQVKPIAYSEQVKYTRSFYTNAFVERYLLLNFNLHEAHHAYPGVPAYHLDKIKLERPKNPKYLYWLIQAKSLKGEDFIFKTSKETGRFF